MINVGHLSDGGEVSRREETEDLSVLLIKTDSFEKMVGSLTNCFGAAGYAMIYSMG
jgi:hypothetical protein